MTLRSKTTSAGLWLALGILALGTHPCPGARPYQPVYGDPLLESWRWRTFPELSGLDAQCMAEGADGTMWFGTFNGLWSYDGIEWGRHSTNEMVGRFVTALCSQTNGNLYIAGEWGISQFSNGNWTRLISAPANRFAAIRKLATGPDGSLWAATSWGALHRRQSTWTLYTDSDTAGRLRQDQSLQYLNIELLPETVIAKFRSGSPPASRCDFTEVCADGQGRIWFGTTGGEVLSHATPANAIPVAAQGTWSLYNESDGLASGLVTSILPLQDGPIWVVHAASEQANVFDGRAWQTIRLPVFIPALGLGEAGGKLLQTRDGVVWLSAQYALYAYRDGQWCKYGQPEVPYPSIRNVVMQSADGALWFAGPNADIHRVDYQTPRWLTLQDLNFQWESPAGAQWFLHRDGRVVVHEANRWTSYGAEDGLMDAPVALLGTRRGEVWAAGSHEHTATGSPERTAATARFDGQKWTRYLHDDFSWGVDWRAVFESSDGSVWFGAFVDTQGPAKHRDGILQFRDGVWIHHHQPGRSPRAGGAENPATLLPASPSPDRPIEKFVCLGESREGKIWAGRNLLAFYNGNKWEEFVPTPKIQLGIIESMFTTQEGDLWIGTREFGALRYDGRDWRHFQGKDSLVANSVRSLAQTADGSIWAATDRGSSRFDGRSWMADVLPEPLNFSHESGSLKASPSGQLWINRYTLYWMRRGWTRSPPPDPKAEFRTVGHQFQGKPPRTTITAGAKIIAQPGNIAVLWSAEVAWREPKDARLQFSFRLDDQPWSAYTSDSGHSFFTLPAGRHHLEVRARDQDFNVDPTPATLDFVVLLPAWQQSWFILLMVLLTGLIVAQSVRVLLERSRLRKANLGLAAEITERERAEVAARENEELYRSFIAASPDGVAVVDSEGRVQYASKRIYELLGNTPKDDVTRTNALTWIAPEDRERATADLVAIANGQVINGARYTFVRQDGSRLPVEISGAPLLGTGSGAARIVTIMRDATARVQAEAEVQKLTGDLEKRVQERTADLQQASDELQHSQQALINIVEDLNEKTAALGSTNNELEAVNKELEAFSYSVSHDLRAPLRGIDGFSQALLEDYRGRLDDEGRHYLQRIRSGAQRMAQLIDDMLNLSRVSRSEMRMEKVNLSTLAQEIADDLARRDPERQVSITIAPDLVVDGDSRLLQVALENLLANAWKFTSKTPAAIIEFGLTRQDGRPVYFVRDNGAGFDMNYAGRLFGAFQRLHTTEEFPGTGVGLATAQRIIHRHGGRIWAESKVGGGATFFFTLQ